MTALRHEDVWLGTGHHVRCCGKGRKERCTPLVKSTVAVLKAWIREQGREDSKTLFPSMRGGALSAAGVSAYARSSCIGGATCPTLQNKRVSPHVFSTQFRNGALAGWRRSCGDRALVGA
jgi:integrase/recombinase XerD